MDKEELERVLGENALNKSEFLDLTNLGLTELPEEVKKLKHVRQIMLDNNSLTSLPDWIGSIDLTLLSLTNNNFEELPEVVTNLRSLKSLFIDDNNIKSLPRSFNKLTNLREYFSCVGNPLETSDDFLYGGTDDFESVYLGYRDLDGNLIVRVDERTFSAEGSKSYVPYSKAVKFVLPLIEMAKERGWGIS